MAEKTKDGGGGGSGMDLLWVFLIVFVLFMMWIQGGGPARAKKEGLIKTTPSSNLNSTSNFGANTSNTTNDATSNESKYKGQIQLQMGTAASTDQANREYIIISANYGNPVPIKIGGWTLRNGRSERAFDISGNTVQGQSVSVVIPSKGVEIYNPYQPASNVLVPITLKAGESATVVTGQVPTIGAVSIRDNFKVNRCLGYIADKTDYRFPFEMYYRCPNVDEMVGVNDLSDACYDFARSISPCHEPKDYYVTNYGNCLERNCNLNSTCRGIIQRSLTFQSCFNQFSKDKDFVGSEWRIFLGRTWEMWGNRRDSISLFDSAGKLVDKISY